MSERFRGEPPVTVPASAATDLNAVYHGRAAVRHTDRRSHRFSALLIGGYAGLMIALTLLRVPLDNLGGLAAFLLMFFPFYFLPAPLIVLVALVMARRWLVVALIPVLIAAVLFRGAWLPAQAAPPAGEADADGLRVATYNMSVKSYAMHAVADFIRALAADVIAIQEVHIAGGRDAALIELLSDVYPFSVVQAGADGYHGVLTFSRFPILESAPLPEFDGLHTRLCAAGRAVDVVNVSLDTPTQDPERPLTGIRLVDQALSYESAGRDAQIDALIVALGAHPNPLIVAGDFNLSDQSRRYADLAALWADSFAAAGEGFGFTWPDDGSRDVTIPSFVPPLVRIDYIFHNGAFETIHADTHEGVQSDHLAVSATLRYAAVDTAPACE
ncbi:MAG: endonuclease/exonuclease/phosphatase family protein [bacterium]|nr:endonuclease/exonuclease/phosphatase family protein [bacterium]